MSGSCDEHKVDEAVEDFLQVCSRQYDSLVEKTTQIRRKGSAEAVLNWIEMVAGFAGMHHPGRFADGAIENVALELGRDLPFPYRAVYEPVATVRSRAQKFANRRVLHVASTLLDIGGLPRMILNWIRKDRGSHHSLVVTSQTLAIPPSLLEAVSMSGGQFVSLTDSASIIERARWLRRFAQEASDLIILHLVPNDIVPIVAFADASKLPVAIVNLADQCFWVGSSVADMVIHLREIGLLTSKELRFTRNDCLLPIPLCETRPNLDRLKARNELRIPEAEIMLLSVGRSIKYIPTLRQNFFRTARKILDRNPNAHLYLIGPGDNDHVGSPGYRHHHRLHLMGPVKDPTVYQRATDVYLEGFPFGSQTALLESVLPGVPCVLAFAPGTSLLATNDFSLTGTVSNPCDEEEYIERVSDFIGKRDKRQRIGATLRENVLRFHVDDSWNRCLERVYEALGGLTHSPTEIPITLSSTRPVDFAISEYHAARLAAGHLFHAVQNDVRDGIFGAAYWLRQRGFYRDSFRFLRIANDRRTWDLKSVLFAGKLVPHLLVHGLLIK